MTVLYYLAAYLTAFKLIGDLDAWTDDSSRAVDLGAFGILGLVMVVLAVMVGL